MAIEIGLHHAPKIWQPSDIESDRKDRVFWIAYAIEISLAYNLGRPPSIGDEHITARLPRYAEETALGIHHINHRRIQSRIVSRVYCGANRAGDVTDDEASCLIFKLQDDLNKWRNALPAFAQSSPYPQRYVIYPICSYASCLTRLKAIGSGCTMGHLLCFIDQVRYVPVLLRHPQDSVFDRLGPILIAFLKFSGIAMFH